MWASVTDGRPTLTQLWFKASCWYHQHTGVTAQITLPLKYTRVYSGLYPGIIWNIPWGIVWELPDYNPGYRPTLGVPRVYPTCSDYTPSDSGWGKNLGDRARVPHVSYVNLLMVVVSHAIWGLANLVSHVLTIIILTFWLEYSMSEVLTLWMLENHTCLEYHISRLLIVWGLGCKISLILTFWLLECHISHALILWRLEYHVSRVLTPWGLNYHMPSILIFWWYIRVSHVSCINPLVTRKS